MNKITYTKHCEFCGTEFTTPIHLRRYCSKSCVRAAYKMRLKERRLKYHKAVSKESFVSDIYP